MTHCHSVLRLASCLALQLSNSLGGLNWRWLWLASTVPYLHTLPIPAYLQVQYRTVPYLHMRP